MSWLTKAESILNKLDQSAGTLLQQKGNEGEKEELIRDEKSENSIDGIRRIPSKNNVLVLKSSSPKKKKKKQVINPDEKILDILNNGTKDEKNDDDSQSQKSQKFSDASSVISKHETVVDKNKDDDQSSVASKSMTSSITSIQQTIFTPFSAEKELSATKMVLEVSIPFNCLVAKTKRFHCRN